MELKHSADPLQSPASQRLREFLRARRQVWQQGVPDFEQFERALHEQIMNLERECLAEELAHYDVRADCIEVGGTTYQPVLQAAETYLSAAGPVRVERHLYRPAGRNVKSLCPLELRAGIINGYWTPRAARHGAFVLAHLPASTAETLFEALGAMQPSRSTLDRLPRTLSAHWEAHRPQWEAVIQVQETVPTEATTLAISVDGVMAPLKPQGEEQEARAAKRTAPGKQASGPTGYREVGCGTLTLYDREGERLHTVQYARMPEPKKVTLGEQLQAEAQAILGARPDLRRVYLADGAETNWELLAEVERALGGNPRTSVQIVDFFHACEHLKSGCDAIWGESTPRGHAEFARLRTLLKEADEGAERIIRTLHYHRGRASGTRRKRIGAALTYFRNQRKRMHYAAYQRRHLPIGSGVVEAACKTLVTQRLKGSGMAWTLAGGQAILTLRSLLQSGRWEQAWPLLAADFRQPVESPDESMEVSLPLAA
jgi:hypothetical protein